MLKHNNKKQIPQMFVLITNGCTILNDYMLSVSTYIWPININVIECRHYFLWKIMENENTADKLGLK